MNCTSIKYNKEKNKFSSFLDCFKNLLYANPKTLWILSTDSFKLPMEWIFDIKEKDFNDNKLYESDAYMLVDTKFLLDYGEYLIDNNNEIIALSIEYQYALKIVAELDDYLGYGITSYVLKRERQGLDCIKFVIQNRDNNYWDVYSKKDMSTYFEEKQNYELIELSEESFIEQYS